MAEQRAAVVIHRRERAARVDDRDPRRERSRWTGPAGADEPADLERPRGPRPRRRASGRPRCGGDGVCARARRRRGCRGARPRPAGPGSGVGCSWSIQYTIRRESQRGFATAAGTLRVPCPAPERPDDDGGGPPRDGRSAHRKQRRSHPHKAHWSSVVTTAFNTDSKPWNAGPTQPAKSATRIVVGLTIAVSLALVGVVFFSLAIAFPIVLCDRSLVPRPRFSVRHRHRDAARRRVAAVRRGLDRLPRGLAGRHRQARPARGSFTRRVTLPKLRAAGPHGPAAFLRPGVGAPRRCPAATIGR